MTLYEIDGQTYRHTSGGYVRHDPDDFYPSDYAQGGLVMSWDDRESYLDWYHEQQWSDQ